MRILISIVTGFILIISTGCSSKYSIAGTQILDLPKHVGTNYKSFIKVPVLLATDRKMNSSEKKYLHKIFTNERGSGKLYYSEVNVTIPKSHKMGTLDKKTIFRLEFVDNPKKNMIIRKYPSLLTKKTFYKIFKKRLSKYSNGDIIIFIHGYNNNIDEAILRTAQISYDLEFLAKKSFIPITYSWASKDEAKKYLTDYEATEWSVPHLKKFLLDVYKNAKGRKINAIVHSMGNQVFTKAISELHQEHKKLKLNQVILAAPDMDAKIFMDNIVPAIGSSIKRTTVYTSNKDKALMVSELIRIQEARLGRSDANLIQVLDFKKLKSNKIDIINASEVKFSLWGLNHSYFAQIKVFIQDISNTLLGKSINQRKVKRIKPSSWWYIQGKT